MSLGTLENAASNILAGSARAMPPPPAQTAPAITLLLTPSLVKSKKEKEKVRNSQLGMLNKVRGRK